MLRVAKLMSPEDLKKKGEVAFESGKRTVLADPSLRSDFVLLCARRDIDREVSSRVFLNLITKACNARFGEMVRNFCEMEKLKGRGKLGFRKELLGMARRENIPSETI